VDEEIEKVHNERKSRRGGLGRRERGTVILGRRGEEV
jgi:hypothetical protein